MKNDVLPSLLPSEKIALDAVDGWLMLGNSEEARKELSAIKTVHPEVALAQFSVHAHNQEWEGAIVAADEVLKLAPNQPDGYVKRAFALHEMGRTEEAWHCLLPVRNTFDKEWVIPYNLACYASQLGREDEAVEFLKKAQTTTDLPVDMRALAFNDPDLEPIRHRLIKLRWPKPRKRRKTL